MKRAEILKAQVKRAAATEKTKSAYLRAIERAEKIIGKGIFPILMENGVWLVRSEENSKSYYKVERDGNHLVCSCPGAQSGYVCKHRALVALYRTKPE